jgi:hypothetical protein
MTDRMKRHLVAFAITAGSSVAILAFIAAVIASIAEVGPLETVVIGLCALAVWAFILAYRAALSTVWKLK